MKAPLLILVVTAAMLAGCSLFIPKETLYLRSAQNHATTEEVRKQLGEPAVKAANQAGEVLWVYEILEQEPGSRWTSIGMRCDEYVLTFDKSGVLRQWTYKTEVHGGELMPTYCVWDGYRRS